MKKQFPKTKPAKELFLRGARQFNSGKFFDAHESWEIIWLRAPEPDKTFLQGITQVSAAFFHRSRRNREGFRSLLGKGLAKLERFAADYRGLRLEELRRNLRRWQAALRGGNISRVPRKPKITFARTVHGARPAAERKMRRTNQGSPQKKFRAPR